jgi:hypothetical protein
VVGQKSHVLELLLLWSKRSVRPDSPVVDNPVPKSKWRIGWHCEEKRVKGKDVFFEVFQALVNRFVLGYRQLLGILYVVVVQK